MQDNDTAISKLVTRPKLFDEALHFRARQGTKARIDALRGDVRQGDYVRELLEEALDRREAEKAKPPSKRRNSAD